MSIFASYDRSFQNPHEFWRSCSSISLTLQELHRGKLLEVIEFGVVSESNFILTKKHLIKLDASGNPEKIASLEWKLISPFQENQNCKARFGFTLGCNNSAKDFYVENEDELNTWISYLSKIGIMTDIEDSYTLNKIIGRGGNSTVFLAESVTHSNLYAIKCISKNLISQSLESLANEIKIMRKLNHPQIVHLHQVFESETHVYMVLDYVTGGTLYDKIIQKKTLPEAFVLKFCREFLKVLDYLRSKKIVHRDIKLENILLKNQDDSLDFKLADFGLATKAKCELTLRCGSPGYIAPEILRKEKYGHKVDIFGAGVIIYTLITGKMPFFGHFQDKVLEKNKECNINFHDNALNHVSKECIQLIQKMTSPYPEQRITPRRALKHKCFSNYLDKSKSLNASMSVFERKSSRKDTIILIKSLEISKQKTKVLQTNFIPLKKVNDLRHKLMKII